MSLQDEHDIATKRPDVKEAYIKLTDAITGARTSMTAQGKPDRCPQCESHDPKIRMLIRFPMLYGPPPYRCEDKWHDSSPVPAAAPNFRTITDPESGERIPIKNNAIEAAPQAESVPSGKDAETEHCKQVFLKCFSKYPWIRRSVDDCLIAPIVDAMVQHAASQTAALAAERDQLQRRNDGLMETLRHYEGVLNIAYYLFVSDGEWDKSANCWKNARAEKAERSNSLLRERLSAIEKILRENERDGYGYCKNCAQFAPNHDENCWIAVLLLSFAPQNKEHQ